MRELKIGGQTVRVRATPLALLYYRQEFGSDLLGDLIGTVQGLTGLVVNGENVDLKNIDFSKFDSVAFLKLIWAMAKADAFGKQFPSFEGWLAGLDSFDLSDPAVMTAAIEEAANGFFRSRAGIKAGVR